MHLSPCGFLVKWQVIFAPRQPFAMLEFGLFGGEQFANADCAVQASTREAEKLGMQGADFFEW